jgi:hypothetical protein
VTATVDAVHFLHPCRLGAVVIVAAMVNRWGPWLAASHVPQGMMPVLQGRQGLSGLASLTTRNTLPVVGVGVAMVAMLSSLRLVTASWRYA